MILVSFEWGWGQNGKFGSMELAAHMTFIQIPASCLPLSIKIELHINPSTTYISIHMLYVAYLPVCSSNSLLIYRFINL